MKTYSHRDLLFIGTHGHVTAINKKTGRKVWSTSLPKTGFHIVSLLYKDGVVYAGSNGYLFALDAADGSIEWSNGLKGLGHGHMVLATVWSGPRIGDIALFASQHSSDASAASAGAGT